ncbi:hypothetical protein ACH3XW_17235 [Acanthocheilonema viteae]
MPTCLHLYMFMIIGRLLVICTIIRLYLLYRMIERCENSIHFRLINPRVMSDNYSEQEGYCNKKKKWQLYKDFDLFAISVGKISNLSRQLLVVLHQMVKVN